jgi:hypothetical protein
MYLSKIFIPLRKTANFYLALRAGTGNRNQSTLFYYHVRHYSFHAIPYHKHRDWYRREISTIPFIYLCVSNIANDCHELPMPMLSQKIQCCHVSEETLYTADSSGGQNDDFRPLTYTLGGRGMGCRDKYVTS